MFLKALSSELERRGRTKLDPRWTICPAGGIDKIQSFVALFAGSKLDIAALTDFAKSDRKKLEALRRNKVLEDQRLMTFATILAVEEADIEDVFAQNIYATMLNEAFNLTGTQRANAKSLTAADQSTTRLLKKAEAYFKVLPPGAPEFDHYTPAEWLFINRGVLQTDDKDVLETLERAEKTIIAANKLLS